MKEVRIMRNTIIVVLVFLLIGCEEFQTETFSASATDLTAINALADSVSISFSTEPLKSFNDTWVNEGLDSIRVALYDTLMADSIVMSALDTAYTVTLPSENDTSYAVFSGATSGIIIFIGEFIDLKIVIDDGNTISPDDTSMELPAIYESLHGTTSTDYYVKSRYVFKDVPQNSIFQFIRNDQTKKRNFKFIIIQ